MLSDRCHEDVVAVGGGDDDTECLPPCCCPELQAAGSIQQLVGEGGRADGCAGMEGAWGRNGCNAGGDAVHGRRVRVGHGAGWDAV